MVTNLTIPEQLTEIYLKYPWSTMRGDEALDYHRKLYNQGNIQTIRRENKVIGYIEMWFVNFEGAQAILRNTFDSSKDDILSGKICFVANLWVDETFRKGWVFKNIYRIFREASNDCFAIMGFKQKRKKFQVHKGG